jgi:hypothetical protein
MKINRTLTQQTLKELAKSISKMADLLEPDSPYGIECKKIKVEKSTDKHDLYHVDISMKLIIIDGELEEAGDIMERFK